VTFISFRQVEAESAKLRTLTGDPEAFHSLEDYLYLRVLRAIATGAANPAELAAEVLKNADITAERWYA
jgi:hypothetical protein